MHPQNALMPEMLLPFTSILPGNYGHHEIPFIMKEKKIAQP